MGKVQRVDTPCLLNSLNPINLLNPFHSLILTTNCEICVPIRVICWKLASLLKP